MSNRNIYETKLEFLWVISRGIEGNEHIARRDGHARPRFSLRTRNDAARLVNYLNYREDELAALRAENAALQDAARAYLNENSTSNRRALRGLLDSDDGEWDEDDEDIE